MRHVKAAAIFFARQHLLCDMHRLLQFKALIQQIIAAVKALYRYRQQHCRKAEAHQLLYQAKASVIFHKQSPCL